jgi:uncharacterized protein
MHDKNIVLDVNSGCVFVFDEISYLIIKKLNRPLYEKCPVFIIKEMKNFYDKQDILDAYDEIYSLYKNNILFSLDKYKKTNIRKQDFIKALCLNITDGCNMLCEYCFAGNKNHKSELYMMSEDVAKKSVDFLIENSGSKEKLEIDFFGGEPLINFEVIKFVVEYAKWQEKKSGKKVSFTLTTNGLLLDDEKIDYINKNMSNVVLSLDGRKEVNDRMRKCLNNKSSYETILPKFIKIANLRNQENYYVRGTYTKYNKDFLNDIIHISELGFKQISFEPVIVNENRDETYAIKNEDLMEILFEYEKLAKEYVKLKNTDKEFNFFHFMIDFENNPCVLKRISGCGVGNEYIAVSVNGDVYPCHQFVGRENFKLGSVFNGITNKNLKKHFKKNNIYTKPECKKCFAKFYCCGGCVANACLISGDFKTPYEIGCKIQQKRMECAIYVKCFEEFSA